MVRLLRLNSYILLWIHDIFHPIKRTLSSGSVLFFLKKQLFKRGEDDNMSKLTRASLTCDDKKEDDKSIAEFKEKRSKAILKARQRERDLELSQINNSFRSERIKKLTTTKIFMYFILLNCTAVEVYSMIIMYLLQDLSALYSLIGAVVGESISYAIYCAKSFHDSKEEAKSLLERDKFYAEQGIKGDSNDIEDIDEDEPDEYCEPDEYEGE